MFSKLLIPLRGGGGLCLFPLSLSLSSNLKFLPLPLRHRFSTTATRYPLQYDMIISRPANQTFPDRRRPLRPPKSKPPANSDPDSEQLDFDEWVDRKLNSPNALSASSSNSGNEVTEMDRSKRKYYNKRRKRMYGSDSEDENGHHGGDGDMVELKQEVVEFRTLHKREEELYFYDAFAFPWEKDKHYKMVYQLEKKYFPDQCFDKAFLQPGQVSESQKKEKEKKSESSSEVAKDQDTENKGLVFFDEGGEEMRHGERDESQSSDVKFDISEKKVEEFFKCLKKVPGKNSEVARTEPFLSSRSLGLPPKWDSPGGTVLLVNKPKGEVVWMIGNGGISFLGNIL